MDPVWAFLLGLLQGVTEWLPISSSGWSVVFANGLGVHSVDALALAFFLHFGTLAAVLARMRSEVRDILVALPRFRTDPLVRYLLVTTAISLPVGLALVLTLEDAFAEREGGGVAVTVMVGVLLLVTGLVLRAAKDRQGERRVDATNAGDWVLLGLAQGVAALPGISRSGMTVSALLVRRVDAAEALRLSFLMSIPVTIAVLAYELVRGNVLDIGIASVIAGILGSFVLGYVTIDALLALSQRTRWDLFCLLFGAIAILAGYVLLLV
jgi:undecaprenyl-diphosphatase